MTDLIICLVIAALMIFAFVKLKKRGSGCGCGCSSCNRECDERKDDND